MTQGKRRLNTVQGTDQVFCLRFEPGGECGTIGFGVRCIHFWWKRMHLLHQRFAGCKVYVGRFLVATTTVDGAHQFFISYSLSPTKPLKQALDHQKYLEVQITAPNLTFLTHPIQVMMMLQARHES